MCSPLAQLSADLAKLVQSDELSGKETGVQETLGHQHDLADETQVGHAHGAWPEQNLQILWQLGPARIAGVHGNEISDGGNHRDHRIHEVKHRLLVTYRVLQAFNLSIVISLVIVNLSMLTCLHCNN